jgi:hypothetical protein
VTAALIVLRPPSGALNDYVGQLLFWVGFFVSPIGAVLGILGGIWLGIVSQRLKTRSSLAVQGAAAGGVLGFVFAVLGVMLDRAGSGHSLGGFVFFCVCMGAITAALYSLVFNKLFLDADTG